MKKNLLFITFILFAFAGLKAQIIFSEDFQGGAIPAGWTQQTKATDGGWKVGDSASMSYQDFTIYSHTKFACTNDWECDCNKSNDMLITPVLDFTNYTKIQLSFDALLWGVSYLDGSGMEAGLIKASIDGGSTWNFLDSIRPGLWINWIVDLSSFAGKDNVKLAFVYNDAGKRMYGLAIDNVKIYIPYDYDMSASNIIFPMVSRTGSKAITGYILNRGALTVDHMNINYQIDNSPVVSETVNNLNLKSAEYHNFTFSNNWNAAKSGNYIIKVWASNINGKTDQNTDNDGMEIERNIFKVGKPVLVEYFTSASCYYCSVFDPGMEKIIAQDNDFVIGLAYHNLLNGNPDPMFNSSNSNDFYIRYNYYSVEGFPSAYINGKFSSNLLYDNSEYDLGQNTSKDTIIEIKNPMAKLSGDNLTFSADFVADKKISANLKAFMAIIEQEIDFDFSPGTNGQTNFPWVMRKMIPNSLGTALPSSLNIGDSKTISGSWKVDATIYNRNQLKVIFFVQNYTTKEMLWAAMLQPTMGIHENKNVNIETIFPNPAKDQTTIYFNLTKPENINLQIRNMLGEVVFTKNLGLISVGKSNYTLNVENLNSGYYSVELINANGCAVKKLSIIK